MKDYNFTGKVVLVTGGTGGLGTEVCLAFLRANALLGVTYYSSGSLQRLSSKLGDLTKNVFSCKVDLTKEDQVKKLVFDLVQKFGKIDVLVNLVGGYFAGKAVTEIDEKEWDAMMNINLKNAFFLSKHVVSHMLQQGSGKVIHVGARPALKGVGFDAAYVASKSGLIRMVESQSEEVKAKGININCILPSIIDTEENRKAIPQSDFTKWVKPTEIGKILMFLASDDSKPINGAAIPVYGLA